MHYYIDGYNLLFRRFHHEGPLRIAREALILELANKASVLQLKITIVFDSQYRLEEGSESYFNDLKICFTNKGETADEWIIQTLKAAKYPSRCMVITSDRPLAHHCRSLSANTQTIEEFVGSIHRRYQNKQRHLKYPSALKPSIMVSAPPLVENSIDPLNTSLEAYFGDDAVRIPESDYDRWLRLFSQEE